MNALSGKIMFRDVIYITHDYTVRVQDGYLIFRWWRSYVPKDVSEGKVKQFFSITRRYFMAFSDLSHSDTRLSVMLNGFELHVYNRSEMYARLEKVFGLGSNIFPNNNYDNKVAEDIERLVKLCYNLDNFCHNFFLELKTRVKRCRRSRERNRNRKRPWRRHGGT